MSRRKSQQPQPTPLAELQQLLQRDGESWMKACQQLVDFARLAREAERDTLARAAGVAASLLEVLTCSESDPQLCDTPPAELLQFIRCGIRTLEDAWQDKQDAAHQVVQWLDDAQQQWGEYLQLMGQSAGAEPWGDELDDGWALAATDADGTERAPAEESEPPSDEQVRNLLAALCGTESGELSDLDMSGTEQVVELRAKSAGQQKPTPAAAPPKLEPAVLDAELLAAFQDDAGRCLTALEQTALRLESDSGSTQLRRAVCRELHTLKGASASVGLSELAAYLHRSEETVENSQQPLAPHFVLDCVDAVRRQLNALGGSEPATESGSEAACAPAADWGESADSVRVQSAQLDRLMDMLAELVMLRNRRDSSVQQLKQIHADVARCAAKLKTRNESSARAGRHDAELSPQDKMLAEVSTDLAESARCLREFFEPVAGENAAVSRFIGQFRQKLVELRRVPVAGLGLRLQRAVHDAAKVEGKQVRLEVQGEQTGVERSLQQRLYEPLLHLVRNAVSHGVEAEEERRAAGKSPQSTLVLDVQSGANLLVIELRDDGKGLDYDALRRRGVERGLLPAGRAANRSELAQLIFHSGFSTRAQANAISGRGVGMDVVAATVERMRGWIEVESEPGQGTTFRLTIPLPSMIEHTMVFRARGQLFALPMQYVHQAHRSQTAAGDLQVSSFAHLCGLEVSESLPAHLLVLNNLRRAAQSDLPADRANRAGRRHLAMLVDEIVGPEEVVVRPLPALLKHQRLFAGATLAGSGEMVLVLDAPHLLQLADHCLQPDSKPTAEHGVVEQPSETALSTRLLVVDDSRSARQSLARALESQGYDVEQAADGLEALDRLRSETFLAVFTDLEMPRLGGFELLRELQSSADAPPVVMVTSRDEAEFRSKAADLGVRAYLTKPVKETELADVLHELATELTTPV